MRIPLAVASILGLCLFHPTVAQAQITGVEFGVDVGFERTTLSVSDYDVSSTVTLIGIPAQWIRVGFHVQDNISIEPRLGLTRLSGEDTSELQVRFPVAVLLHVQPNEDGPSFFFEGIGGIDYVSASYDGESESASQFRVGGGAGVLLPIGDAFFFRGAGEYHRSFETDDLAAANRIIITAGFSFFLE